MSGGRGSAEGKRTGGTRGASAGLEMLALLRVDGAAACRVGTFHPGEAAQGNTPRGKEEDRAAGKSPVVPAA